MISIKWAIIKILLYEGNLMILRFQSLKLVFYTLILLTSYSISSFAASSDLMKLSSIKGIMDQIFEQHVDKKQINPDLLTHAYTLYIEQFDPDHIYLLQDEVAPFLNPSQAQLQEFLSEYKNQNYSTFKKLNKTIETSILRARKYRKELQNEKAVSSLGVSLSPFAENTKELKLRILQDMALYYAQEGEKLSITEAWAAYDRSMREKEDLYMETTDAGVPLPQALSEHYFVLHVLKAVSGGLDSHTKFLDNSEAFDLKIRLEKSFHGIGVRLGEKDHAVYITCLIEGGPAIKNGKIKPNDRIIAVNGISTIGKSVGEVIKLLHQDEPATTTLVLERPNEKESKDEPEKINVSLVRAKVDINDGRVQSSFVPFQDGIIGEITIHSFYRNNNGVTTFDDVKQALKELNKEGKLRGLVLDLRDNLGGFLTQAVQVAGLFISSGVIVISKFSNGEEQFYRDLDGKVTYSGPLVILTSRETASAAEIVTQALQDYGVAIVVGDEHTYGKGTIQSQTVTEAGNPTFFKVTVGKYYTVSGKTPQKSGVHADIVVPSQLQSYLIGEEYLEYTESSDSIPPTYKDPLKDIEPLQQSWYLHYYEPHIQKKVDTWDNMLTILRRKSKARLSQNTDYQLLLKGGSPKDKKNWLFPSLPEDADTQHDLQMQETINIVKDMITQK